jgi:polar amino acid transport system substrate-binding protein
MYRQPGFAWADPGAFRQNTDVLRRKFNVKRVGKITKGRAGLLGTLLLVLVLLLAGCGGAATATPTAVGGGAGVTTPVVAPTDTTAASAATDTPAVAADTPTEAAMAGETPSAAAGGGGPTSNATPVSDWKPGTHANSVPAPSKLVSGGTLTVGSDVSYPPQEYNDAAGNAVGMDIDIVAEIASRLGLQLKVVNFKFDNLIPALQAGQFDIVVSAMTVTDERKQVVNFVPYFEAGQAVLVKKGNPKNIKTLDDLSGLTAVAQQGTTEEQSLKDENTKLQQAGKPLINVLTYPSDTDAVDQLRIGRADATLHDSPVAAYYSKINPDFEVAIPVFDSAPEGIAIAKTNADMTAAITKAVDDMKSDGTLDKIVKDKWGIK